MLTYDSPEIQGPIPAKHGSTRFSVGVGVVDAREVDPADIISEKEAMDAGGLKRVVSAPPPHA